MSVASPHVSKKYTVITNKKNDETEKTESKNEKKEQLPAMKTYAQSSGNSQINDEWRSEKISSVASDQGYDDAASESEARSFTTNPTPTTLTATTTTTTTVPASTTTTTTTVPTRPEQEQIIEAVLEPVGVIVAQVDEPKIELQPPPPAYVLPVAELQRSSEPAASTTVEVEATTLPSVAIPAGITEIVCGSECLGALGEAADIEDGAIEIQVGSEVILVDEGMREVIIPLSPRARQIRVTVTPTDGGEPVVLERSVFVLSPSNVPLKPGPTFTSGARVTETSSGATGGRSPIPFVVAAIVAILAHFSDEDARAASFDGSKGSDGGVDLLNSLGISGAVEIGRAHV